MTRRLVPLLRDAIDDRGAAVFLAVLAGVAIGVPVLNLLVPASSALHVSTYVLTLVGAFTLGIANKFLEPVAGAVLGKIAILVLIILFIQKRPRGLFALKGRAVEA